MSYPQPHHFLAKFADSIQETINTDTTQGIPHFSLKGMQYVFVVSDSTNNKILVRPCQIFKEKQSSINFILS